MTWFYATSVSVTNGATVVSVNAGDDIALIQPSDALIIGTQPPVEIKRTYLDGSSNKKIELLKPWPYGSQTNQSAEAYPTAGDFQAATAVLKQFTEAFTLATQAEAQAGTENTKPMTALRVKQAMDALLGSASKLTATTSITDRTAGRALRVADLGIGTNFMPYASVDASMSPTQVLAAVGSDGVTYFSGVALHGGAAPQSYGSINGYITSSNGYSYAWQEFNGINAGKWRRIAASPTSWTTWAPVYDGLNAVGAVSLANGVNTGSIIERGSNANGDYVKLADGTMFCFGSRVGALSTTQYAGISNLRSGEYTWFFPASFLAGTVPSIGGHGGDQSYAGWLGAAGLSSTQCNVVYFTATVSPTAFIYPVAKGRWR